MHLLSTLLFAFSANIDNFTIGIAYGIKKIKICWLNNLLIACVTSAGTFISMAAGLAVSQFLTASAANAIGSIILILIGSWIIKDFFLKKEKPQKPTGKASGIRKYDQILNDPETADNDHSGTIDSRESLVLALALTVNNFGLGLGASITGLNIYATVISTFFFSLISIALGCLVGKSCISKFSGKFAPLISGLIILLLGVYELLI
mgnify:CR=1 FL=1